MNFTRHAKVRMAQRGIDDVMVALKLEHGAKFRHNKARIITLGRKQLHKLETRKEEIEMELSRHERQLKELGRLKALFSGC